MLTYFTLNLIISDGKRLATGFKRGRISRSHFRPVNDGLCLGVHTMTVRAHSWPLCFIKQAVTHAARSQQSTLLTGRGGKDVWSAAK